MCKCSEMPWIHMSLNACLGISIVSKPIHHKVYGKVIDFDGLKTRAD